MPSENRFIVLILAFVGALMVGSLLFPAPAFSGSLPGHLMGIAGAVIMSLTLVYPFRKRVQGKRGKRNPLAPHIYYGLIGPTLVVLHSGYGFASLIATLANLSMVLMVLSGIAGTFLFQKVNRSLREMRAESAALKELFQLRKSEVNTDECLKYLGIEGVDETEMELVFYLHDESLDPASRQRCAELVGVARSMAEVEHATQVFNATKKIFSHWIVLHVHLAILLFAMVGVHILTSLYYGLRWLP